MDNDLLCAAASPQARPGGEVTTVWTIHVALTTDGGEYLALARVGEFAANARGKTERVAVAEALARLSFVMNDSKPKEHRIV